MRKEGGVGRGIYRGQGEVSFMHLPIEGGLYYFPLFYFINCLYFPYNILWCWVVIRYLDSEFFLMVAIRRL